MRIVASRSSTTRTDILGNYFTTPAATSVVCSLNVLTDALFLRTFLFASRAWDRPYAAMRCECNDRMYSADRACVHLRKAYQEARCFIGLVPSIAIHTSSPFKHIWIIHANYERHVGSTVAAPFKCPMHSTCTAVGQIVAKPGTHEADTVCGCRETFEPSVNGLCQCVPGRYLDNGSCKVARKCDKWGQLLLKAHTPLHDSVCTCRKLHTCDVNA